MSARGKTRLWRSHRGTSALPADGDILSERERIKQRTIENCRLQHRLQAA
jgi:hypothetical protein